MFLRLAAVLIAVSLAAGTVRADPRQDWKEGASAVFRGEVVPGVAQLTRAIDSGALAGDELAEALVARGTGYVYLQEADPALADFERAIATAPTYPLGHQNRANVLFELGKTAEALAGYEETMRLDPKYPFAWVGRARVRERTGDVPGAIADLDEAIRLNAYIPDTYGLRGWLHRIRGEREAALADFERYIEIRPESGEGYFLRGFMRFDAGDYANAAGDFARAATRRDATIHAIYMRFVAQSRGGRDVRQGLAQVIRNPSPREWPQAVAAMFLGQAPPEAVLEAARDPDPETERQQLTEAQFYIGQHHLLAGARERAIAAFREATRHGVSSESLSAREELRRLGAD